MVQKELFDGAELDSNLALPAVVSKSTDKAEIDLI